MTAPSVHEVVDAIRLTEVLRSAGLLLSGQVREVRIENQQNTVLSRIIRLALSYDASADGAPSSLILKTCHPDRVETFWFAGRNEVEFYRGVAPGLPSKIVPRCFEAEYNGDSKLWHLLLEDLTATHQVASAWPFPPDAPQCEAIVTALAHAHAAWWDDSRLGNPLGRLPDEAFFDRFGDMFERFRARVGDRLAEPRCELYRRLIEETPRLRKRFERGRDMTITHGDAHSWNFLLPREGVADTARVFDWDSWRVGLGSDDLSYMLTLQWYPERRARLERTLLDRYHAALEAGGVEGYSRAALDEDYRLSTLFHILTPMAQWWNNIPPVIWWNNLERIMMAVEDLDCRALLD